MRSMIFCLILSLALSVHAKERAMFVADGYANHSCGMYTEERRKDSVEYYLFIQWLKGYITGLSQERTQDIVRGRDYEGLLAWLDNYCKANPLTAFVGASSSLVEELSK